MTFEVKILADSINIHGQRITSFSLKYPRFIHSELMSHRAFSRNAASSRAISIKKMIEQVETNPAMPIHWGLDRKGMQATTLHDETLACESAWKIAANNAVKSAKLLSSLGLHKQVVNRVLEPFQIMNTIVTATDFDNFFALRVHKDAQPEIQRLAHEMKLKMNNSIPLLKQVGEWHIPFITEEEKTTFSLNEQLISSVARSARVSYLNHEGILPTLDKDKDLFSRLILTEPMHASPAEHQAMVTSNLIKESGNFSGGWKQLRHSYTVLNNLKTLI